MLANASELGSEVCFDVSVEAGRFEQIQLLRASPQPLRFELRQYHAVTSNAQILFHDAPQGYHAGSTRPNYRVKTRKLKSHRPSSQEAFHKARARSLQSEPLRWDEEEIEAPDVESRETLLTLSKMSNNAYLDPGESGWYDLGDTWNVVCPVLKTISSFLKRISPILL